MQGQTRPDGAASQDLANDGKGDMAEIWKIGDLVQTNLEHAWVYEGTEREGLMGAIRAGTVIGVPDATIRQGFGTLLVRWESLTKTPLKRSDWWTHSDLIVRIE